ncbi:MAG TPA: TonB-dependent receptor [Steroidobacteraceae bacterium]|nr:TonB-dependent receptor [Steroidobacteraceae bacterium]
MQAFGPTTISILALATLVPAAIQAQVAEPATNTASANSDQAGASGLDEIVVTAQRRGESLQDVPISVNAVTGAQLEQRGISNINSLSATVPALEVPRTGSASTPFLRGVGSNAANPNDEPSVAMYVDGVYIAAPFANLFSFNNVDRVEVLKGPQGTLFGRNATGGVIQVITREPQHAPSGQASVGYGNYDTISGDFYGTTGITDAIAADLAIATKDQRDGWGRNATLDKDTFKGREVSARSKWSIEAGDATRVVVSGDYAKSHNSFTDYQLPDGVIGLDGQPAQNGRYETHNNTSPLVEAKQYGGSVRVDHSFAAMNFVSISSYRHSDGQFNEDPDATPVSVLPAFLSQKAVNWTQEFQLASPEDAAFSWLVGAFYYHGASEYNPGRLMGLSVAPATALDQFGKQTTDSASLYGQTTVPVLDSSRLTVGLRYTTEQQDYDSALEVDGARTEFDKIDQNFDKLTWRLAFDHDFAPDVRGYISYNRGIKSGGFDLLSVGQEVGYDPEILDAYEIGLKSELFDRRLRINGAVFFYDYKDIQVQSIRGVSLVTSNAAGAEIKGVDVEIQAAPVRHLMLNAGIAYLDGEYTDFPEAIGYPASPLAGPQFSFDASGSDTIRTPKFTGNVGFTYDLASSIGTFTLGANAYYNDGFYWDAQNRSKQDSYSLFNASLSWAPLGDRFEVTLWGNNLGDEQYLISGVPSGFGDLQIPAAPRTYGVTLNVPFE